ncbi:uncharacterized protein SPAPADRAFT_136981 [Spathaspora passalidarum NRRL Y-27907]|uniref:Uncharacterized protein n=1 Tax=Spathaspora passalidarum (strain NRRL Y-27907 / 11-Y1) TaxID=619300 RepID=G3AKU6_SPAPN|nr:uncharacterized protein SPAPADRAFT_136981 [Spathaspora passalidarum NRRL Y-27907]EGW33649.1 hypothetical protein SPAPADRAFT_136981 [Spathaspora passalidarum NRRL Y-27907]
MSTSRDTPKLVSLALNAASKIVESDTNVSTIDLNLLENLNTNQSLNYIKLEKNLDDMETNSNQLKQLKAEFESHSQELISIENKIAILEEITTELDQWSKQLEHNVESAVNKGK